MPLGSDGPRFLSIVDVAEVLNISEKQAYALVRRGDLRGIRIGGRGIWRVEQTELEAYIERQYAESDRYRTDHPFEPMVSDRPGDVDGTD